MNTQERKALKQKHTCRLPGDVHHFNLRAQLEQGCQQLVSPAIDACVKSVWWHGAVLGYWW